jgi:hypothetical protein
MAQIIPIPLGGRVILDTGAVLAWASGNSHVRQTIALAVGIAIPIIVPIPVLAQLIRGGPRDAPINLVLKSIHDHGAMTPQLARQAGVLLGRTRTIDVVDTFVVAEALRILPTLILTSDPRDIRLLVQSDPSHPHVRVVSV